MTKTILLVAIALVILVLLGSYINPLPVLDAFDSLGFIGTFFGGAVTLVSSITALVVANRPVFVILLIFLVLWFFDVLIKSFSGGE